MSVTNTCKAADAVVDIPRVAKNVHINIKNNEETKDKETDRSPVSDVKNLTNTVGLTNIDSVTKDADAASIVPAGSEETIEKTASDNAILVQDHYNALSMQNIVSRVERNESRILYMRNFNNWIKTMLINEYLTKVKQDKVHGASLRVLDMCCGKGGDILKWKKANITYLICADISDMSVDHCQKRYNEMLRRNDSNRGFWSVFNAEFITADCTKVRLKEKFRDPSTQLDFVSCQFAFHYCFESLQQAECMLKNASESLKPGGYFIGTMPDAYDLVSRWRRSEGNKFGNEIYSVEFDCGNKEKPPLFGAKYNFRLEGVVNCPEFLVHLPTFCKLASKFGLKLVAFERFGDYYERMLPGGKVLLDKMQAFETYPPPRGYKAQVPKQSKSEYEHAEEYISNRDYRKGMTVGTLSRSEWEVISLYAVFAFKKMKTKWNSEGKPEYEDL